MKQSKTNEIYQLLSRVFWNNIWMQSIKLDKITLSIRELVTEREDDKIFLSQLIRDGGDALPEEIQDHIDNLQVLISRLELEKDKLQINVSDQEKVDVHEMAATDENGIDESPAALPDPEKNNGPLKTLNSSKEFS